MKYTDKQKLEAVDAYRKGTGGLLATAKAQGVHVDSLRKWVAGHSARGAAGVVTKKRRNYDLNFKLEVLRRVSDEGISCRQAAALFDSRRSQRALRTALARCHRVIDLSSNTRVWIVAGHTDRNSPTKAVLLKPSEVESM